MGISYNVVGYRVISTWKEDIEPREIDLISAFSIDDVSQNNYPK